VAIEAVRDIQKQNQSAFAVVQRAPTVSQVIAAGNSAIAVRKYAIASGTKLTIGLGATLRVL
jgi:hypothetical protein